MSYFGVFFRATLSKTRGNFGVFWLMFRATLSNKQPLWGTVAACCWPLGFSGMSYSSWRFAELGQDVVPELDSAWLLPYCSCKRPY